MKMHDEPPPKRLVLPNPQGTPNQEDVPPYGVEELSLRKEKKSVIRRYPCLKKNFFRVLSPP
jgi:hypothetical protein